MNKPNSETPLHHVPTVQGMHQATMNGDPWGAFFTLCWEEFEGMQQRRQARHQEYVVPVINEPTGKEKNCA